MSLKFYRLPSARLVIAVLPQVMTSLLALLQTATA
jgi:hypothetical protein